MDYINFGTVSKKTLLKTILNSHKDINILSSESLFDYFQYILLVRHDILHFLLLCSFQKPWEPERRIDDFFDIDIPPEFAKKNT